MDAEWEKAAIHEKLARCRQLQREFPTGVTAANLHELEAELLRELRQLEKQDRRWTAGTSAVFNNYFCAHG
jgi:hypothetical protein